MAAIKARAVKQAATPHHGYIGYLVQVDGSTGEVVSKRERYGKALMKVR